MLGILPQSLWEWPLCLLTRPPPEELSLNTPSRWLGTWFRLIVFKFLWFHQIIRLVSAYLSPPAFCEGQITTSRSVLITHTTNLERVPRLCISAGLPSRRPSLDQGSSLGETGPREQKEASNQAAIEREQGLWINTSPKQRTLHVEIKMTAECKWFQNQKYASKMQKASVSLKHEVGSLPIGLAIGVKTHTEQKCWGWGFILCKLLETSA